jgi:hypothetical protein
MQTRLSSRWRQGDTPGIQRLGELYGERRLAGAGYPQHRERRNWKRNHPDFVESLRQEVGDEPAFVVRSRRAAEELLARPGISLAP